MTKTGRHNSIMKIVEKQSIGSQDELRKALVQEGCRVTQATLSRDIRELGLVKAFDGYRFPTAGILPTPAEQALPSAERLIREFVTEVREAQNLLVIKTAVGSAQPVAASMDGENWPEVVGTIGGDDTLLIVASDNRSAHRVANRLR